MTQIKPWNLVQLNQAMHDDLRSCQTDTERGLCKAICQKEIREKAKEFSLERKLTPGEIAVAREAGYRG